MQLPYKLSMKIFIRWYPWSMGVNHSFKEKKHRRERPMKNKMKGSPKKNRNRRNLSSLSYRSCPKRTIIYKADIVVVLIKLKKSGMHTYFTACYTFLVKLVVQEKNFGPHVTFPDQCAMLSCLALNLYTYTRLIKKFNIFVMNNRNNMVPLCVRGLGLVTSCLCVKRLFEISIVSCRVCSITAIG